MKANHIMVAATGLILLIACTGLTGCGQKHIPETVVTTQQVDVPISQAVEAPKELRRSPLAASEIPQAVAPGTAGASVCYTPEGQDKLRHAIRGDHDLLGEWSAWAFH